MKPFTLKRFIWNKRALGAPVGNLIILVAAVVLSTTVVLFAVNVTSNQVQKENLYIKEAVLTTENAVITIENTGPTSIRVTQLTIKGDKLAEYTSEPAGIATDGLAKGQSATLTIELPDGLITINDVGRPITIVVSTTQLAYFTETLVQAATAVPTPPP
jgi:hypothetical protein